MMKTMRRSFIRFCFAIIVCIATGIIGPSPVNAQVLFTTPVQINGIFNPDTIYPSQTSRLTINVYNPNIGQLTAVNWTDTLPDDLVVVSPVNPILSGCGGAYTLTATPGTNIVALSGATTEGTKDPTKPGICSVTVSVTSFTVGNHTNVIHKTDGSITLGGTVSNYQYDANITMLVLPMSAPSVTKSFSPDEINAGDPSQLIINIKNNDSEVALTQVTLKDSLPTDMTVANTSVSYSNCGSGTLVPISVGDTVLNFSGGTIAVNTTCTIRVNVALAATGTYTNRILKDEVTTFQKVKVPSDATADLVVKNIDIDKNFSPNNFQVGGESTLTITIVNPSTTTDLTNVHFTDTMPAGVTVVSGSGAISGSTGCAGTVDTSAAGSLSLNSGFIPMGGTCEVTAKVTSSTTGTHHNTLSCSEFTFGTGIPGCADASADLIVYPTGEGLGLVKGFSPRNIAPGATTTLQLTITAPGDTGLTSFHLADTMPAGVTVVSGSGAITGTGCSATVDTSTPGSLIINNGVIPIGASCVVTATVTSTVYGPHINTIHPIDITNTENRNISDDVTADFTVRDISVTKSFANSIVGRNGITKLTIRLTNNYTNPLSAIAFTDTLPGPALDDGLIVANPANMTNTCNGTVTATSGTKVISLTGGSIAASQYCTITVDVQGVSPIAPPAGTTFTNRIAIGDVTGLVNGVTPTKNWAATSAGVTVGSPDFRINKKFDPILVTGDTASTMTITLVNTESAPVSGISFTDTLPNHMLLANPPSPSVGTCGGTITPNTDRKSFRFSGGSLAAKSQCKLTIKAIMDITGNLINTIPANSVTTTQGMSNLDPTSATLTNLSSVGVTKKFDPNPVAPGEVTRLTLTVKKNGVAIGLTGLGMSDTLLNGLTIAASPAATNNCGGSLSAPDGGTLIQLTGGAMPIGTSTCAIVVSVKAPETGIRIGGYENCIPVGNVVTTQGYTNVMETCDTLGSLFDPPTGYKTFDASGLPLLEWRMVWINDHDSANINAQIRDTIPTGTTYLPGSLTCDPRGTSSTLLPVADNCTYDSVANQIFWSGVIGPDRGATNEATALNEVVITFRVTVPSTLHVVSNRSPSVTDTDGDTSFTDETTSASVSTSNISTWYRFGAPSGSADDDDSNGADELPAAGFVPDVHTPLPDMPAGIYRSLSPLQMEIPSLGLKTGIVGLSVTDKKWDVSWLGSQLGYLEESAFPTWNGNSVIAGHVYDAQGNPGPFNKLNTLHYGDRIIVHSYGQVYIYEVREMLTVAPDDFKSAFKHQDNSWVTLLTCQGYDETNNRYQSRVLVRAVLIRVE